MYPVFSFFLLSSFQLQWKNKNLCKRVYLYASTYVMQPMVRFFFVLFLLENKKLFGVAMVVLPIYRRYICKVCTKRRYCSIGGGTCMSAWCR